MGICTDKSVKHLQKFGYNVVMHPRASVAPLQLIGEANGARDIIGTVDQLLANATGALPSIAAGGDTANISGKSTSKLDLSLGINILGEILGALGGSKLGVTAAYNHSKTIEFTYDDVDSDTVNILSLGDFMVSGTPKWDHPILSRYLGDDGKLYVITEVVRSNKFGVTAYDKNGTSLGVDVPVISAAVGGNIKIGTEGESTRKVNYEGGTKLTFGFKAFRLSRGEESAGAPKLVIAPVKPGGVVIKATGGNPAAPKPALFDGPVVLNIDAG